MMVFSLLLVSSSNFGAHSTLGEMSGVVEDFGVALALLGRFLGVSVFDDVALGVRLTVVLVALVGASGGFSTGHKLMNKD